MEPAHSLHKDHRSRLRGRFLRAGLADFSPHNVLELLLFYPIPRRDTNPTAHALLSRFGTVERTLAATCEELTSVAGVGAGVARFFAAFRAIGELSLRCPPRPSLSHADALGTRLGALLAEEGAGEDECAVFLFLDNDFREIAHSAFHGSIHSSSFSPTVPIREALLSHAPLCAVAHRHADGLALPGGDDLNTTRLLRDAFGAAGVKLLEHYIIGGGRFATLLYRHSGHEGGVGASVTARRDGGEEETLRELLTAAHVGEDPTALLSAYGGLHRLLAAPVALHRHKGLGEGAAALFSLVLAVDAYCADEHPVPRANEEEALGSYLARLLRSATEERVLLLLFAADGRHISTHTVGLGGVGEASLSCRRIAEEALFSGARQAVLAHNHPHGTAVPSEEDRVATDLISRSLGGLGIPLLGHYIVAGEEYSVIL